MGGPTLLEAIFCGFRLTGGCQGKKKKDNVAWAFLNPSIMNHKSSWDTVTSQACVCAAPRGKKWSALWLDEPFLFDSKVHLSFFQVSDRVDSRALETPKSCRWDSSSIGWHSKNIKTLHYIYKWWSNCSSNNNNKSLLEHHSVIPFCHFLSNLSCDEFLGSEAKTFGHQRSGSRRGVLYRRWTGWR